MTVANRRIVSRASIHSLLKCLPSVRATFYQRGFELPAVFLAAVEALRARAKVERDYQFFLDEVLSETASLAVPWQPTARSSLRRDERSQYLDMLAENFHGDSSAKSLDPNFNIFAQLGESEWAAQLERLRLEKQRDEERLSRSPDISDAFGAALRTETLDLGLLRRVAELQGYHVSQAKAGSRTETLQFESGDDGLVRASLRLVDLRSLTKRGNVTLQYFFPEHWGSPLGLDSFVAGGYLYSQWNKRPASIVFAFYAQCRFLSDLRSGFTRCLTP